VTASRARLDGLVRLAMLAVIVSGCARPARLTSEGPDAGAAGAAEATASEGADVAAIRAARERSNRAIAAHDTAAIAVEWMPDISVVTSAGLQLRGRDENARRFADQFLTLEGVWYRREPDSVRVWAPWGMAAEYGRWRGGWTQGGEKVDIGGAYFGKWQRRDGRWLIQAEIYVPAWCRGTTYCAPRPGTQRR
jgi:ketosteroid isomerase-like protein